MTDFTKRAIMQSFIELLNEKPFHKITVKDIVEHCGINRNTFYYHFEDIYDLLNKLLEEEIEKSKINKMTYENWQDIALESMKFLIENKKATLHIFNSIGTKELTKYLKTTFYLAFSEYLTPFFKSYGVKDEDQKFLLTFYSNALVGFSLDWIEKGLEEEYAVVLVDLINKWFQGNIEREIKRVYGQKMKND